VASAAFATLGSLLRLKVLRAAERLLSHTVNLYFATAAKVRFPPFFNPDFKFPETGGIDPLILVAPEGIPVVLYEIP
jgi:hypothetical protein